VRKIKLGFFISFIVLASAIAFSGCGLNTGTSGDTERPGTTQSDSDRPGEQGNDTITSPSPFERYSISMNFGMTWDQSYWVVDRDGATVPEEKQFTVLHDVLTGEPQCLVRTKYEKVGVYEYGGIMSAEFSAVFDLEGNLIIDWDEYNYFNGFGDFIIRQQSWRSFEEAMQGHMEDGEYHEPKREL
jgi:hypothetical protein